MRAFYLPAGTTLARYELVRPIGRGGNGVVYEAFDALLSRRVALKVCAMPDAGALARHHEERFLREARAAAHVRHPNVVNVFDFGVEGDLAFLVMELVEGETLAALLRREGALGIARTLEILLPILSAAAKLHAHGVVHRDIKPANILLGTGDGAVPKLTDFGLSRFVEEASNLTDSGVTMGTPEYMAPEVTRGLPEASERSDQYALGVVLYECVTGARPFRGATAYDVMQAVVRGAIVPPSTLEPSLPEGFDRAVLRAMHREPRKRFASVDQLAGALVAFASEAVAERWQGEPGGLGYSLAANSARTGEGAPEILVNDGVAIAIRGDVFTALWKAAARIDRIRWAFDIADQVARRHDEGIVALVIVLPSSSPPDHRTMIEWIKCLRNLRRAPRRQATVAVGGGIWQSVVLGVHRVIFRSIPSGAGRLTISGTIDEGIARLLEKASPATPSLLQIQEDVLALHEALDVTPPKMCVSVPRASGL